MHNYVLKKIKKKKGMTLNTVLTPIPLQTPPHKSHRSGVCVSTTVPRNQKKNREINEQKEAK
jgi:hypothetical protein